MLLICNVVTSSLWLWENWKNFYVEDISLCIAFKGTYCFNSWIKWHSILIVAWGRTAHSSKFAIPVPTLQNSTCNVLQGSELAELLKVTKLIIWDEAPMAHKFCFEALDKSLRDLMSSSNNGDSPYGGKVVVFGGDFRQIHPVIPRGTRSDIVNATTNAFYLWEYFKVLKLIKKHEATKSW